MKKTTSILAILVLFFTLHSSFSLAQVDAGIKMSGLVLDGASGKPIRNATIYLAPTNQIALTDSTGHLRFDKLAAKDYTIIASASGYKTEKQVINVGPKDIDLLIYMNEPAIDFKSLKPRVPVGNKVFEFDKDDLTTIRNMTNLALASPFISTRLKTDVSIVYFNGVEIPQIYLNTIPTASIAKIEVYDGSGNLDLDNSSAVGTMVIYSKF